MHHGTRCAREVSASRAKDFQSGHVLSSVQMCMQQFDGRLSYLPRYCRPRQGSRANRFWEACSSSAKNNMLFSYSNGRMLCVIWDARNHISEVDCAYFKSLVD